MPYYFLSYVLISIWNNYDVHVIQAPIDTSSQDRCLISKAESSHCSIHNFCNPFCKDPVET